MKNTQGRDGPGWTTVEQESKAEMKRLCVRRSRTREDSFDLLVKTAGCPLCVWRQHVPSACMRWTVGILVAKVDVWAGHGRSFPAHLSSACGGKRPRKHACFPKVVRCQLQHSGWLARMCPRNDDHRMRKCEPQNVGGIGAYRLGSVLDLRVPMWDFRAAFPLIRTSHVFVDGSPSRAREGKVIRGTDT